MGRQFVIVNVSGEAGSETAKGIPPLHPLRQKGVTSRHREPSRVIVDESGLRPLIGFIRRGLYRVEALDGLPLPSWMSPPSTPAPVVTPVEGTAVVPDDVSGTLGRDEEMPTSSSEDGKELNVGALLDSPARQVIEELGRGVWTPDELLRLLDAERAGKERKTVMAWLASKLEGVN